VVPIDNFLNFLQSFFSKKFKNLWDAQKYILEKYISGFSFKDDVAVELPTGAGKTLIALLIAEAWRRDNKKVAILSANKTLARQMNSECLELSNIQGADKNIMIAQHSSLTNIVASPSKSVHESTTLNIRAL